MSRTIRTSYKVVIKDDAGLPINQRTDGTFTDLDICDDLLQEGDTITIVKKVK